MACNCNDNEMLAAAGVTSLLVEGLRPSISPARRARDACEWSHGLQL
jgi:hypothetical protein